MEKDEKILYAQRLATMYENNLEDVRGAIRSLEVVSATDPDDLVAISKLVELCESVEMWERTTELLARLIEVEGDRDEASNMARRMSSILFERLEKGQEALEVLSALADDGDEPCRDAFIELGDKLGFKGIVAVKMREWYAGAPAAKQQEAFRGAFERFVEMGRDGDAAQMAVELVQSKGATPEIVEQLEQIAVRLKDLDALGVAHDLLAREKSGPDRAAEYVRQAEVLVQAGVEPAEAVQQGEQGLTSMPPNEVEPLLERLAALLSAPGHVIDLYERQVGRCKNPTDRLTALARAAQVAAQRGSNDRAQQLFELALSGGVREETLEVLERAAAEGDAQAGGKLMRQILANSLASGSSGLRDGGRTRSALLRRASNLAWKELEDLDKAFEWLSQALVTHVEPATLDALEEMGEGANALKRVEEILGKALEEVFDGPLVRQLVGRRAKLRRDKLGDKQGAAQDFKKLHDLSPTDTQITDELYTLLTELRDYRSMVQLLEDQILRGKDPALRAELARKAARLWEERLADPREAADAWRRVLRMKPGDTEAQAGLDRAKSNMLKKPESLQPPPPEEFSPLPRMPSHPAPKLPSIPVQAAPAPKPAPAPEPAAEPATEPPAELAPPASAPYPDFNATAENPVPTAAEPVDDATGDLTNEIQTSIDAAPAALSEPVYEVPLQPTATVARRGDEPTLSTPVDMVVPPTILNSAEPLPATTQPDQYVPEDLIESLDDAEAVDDAELLPVEPETDLTPNPDKH